VLPEAVRKQRDAAEAAQKQLSGNPDEQAPNNEPEQPKQQQQEVPAQEPNSQKQEPPKQEQQPDERENDPQYWKNRFLTLQGKYNKEVPALTTENAELKRELEQAQKQPDKQPESVLTEEELEEYGDLGPMIERVARRIADERTKPLEESTKQATQQAYFAQLDDLSPGWRDINTDEGFNDWLDELDVATNRRRRTLLEEAFNSGDAKRTAYFFNTWANTNKPAADKQPQDNGPSPLPDSHQRETAREQFDQPAFTSAEIQQFYADKAKGKYRGREEEAAAIEKQIFASLNGSKG
jgi:hypothetical protein